MFINEKQLEELKKAPPTDVDEDGNGVWDVTQDSEGLLEVKYLRFAVGGYERFITPEGDVKRWDGDKGELVDATFEPLIGSYVSRLGSKPTTRTYQY